MIHLLPKLREAAYQTAKCRGDTHRTILFALSGGLRQ